MYLLFSDSPGIGSLIIKFFTRSKWSHVDIVLGDNLDDPKTEIVGALAKGGVTRYALGARLEHSTRARAVRIRNNTDESVVEAVTWLNSQVGKSYDWGAIVFAIGLNRDWRAEDKWFCSELGGTFALKCGMPVVDPDVHHRVTPQDIYNSPFPKIFVR